MTLEEAIKYFAIHRDGMCLLSNKESREIANMLRELQNFRENLDIAKNSEAYKADTDYTLQVSLRLRLESDAILRAKYCEGWKDAVDFMEVY